MHTLHGRALAVATGVKMANHDLTVVVTGGDGDGFGIGGNHFIHTMRRNVDLLYLAMDNQIYGLTTGQVSPTSRIGMKTKSTPFGSVEGPINPISLALAAGATFVARGFSGDQKHLTDLIKQGLEHKGFSFIDVFSPCVTYNHDNTYPWFKQRVKKLEDDPSYDSSNWMMALRAVANLGRGDSHRQILPAHRSAVARPGRARARHRRPAGAARTGNTGRDYAGVCNGADVGTTAIPSDRTQPLPLVAAQFRTRPNRAATRRSGRHPRGIHRGTLSDTPHMTRQTCA